MANILGLRSTGNVVTDGRPKNWREAILRKYPNGSAGLTPFLALVEAEETSDPEFNWWEKDLPLRRVYVNNAGGYLAGATTFAVDDGAGGDPGKILRAGYLLKNIRTKEQMRVTTDQAAGTSVVVERAFGETAAAALNDNDELRVVGNVNEEGAQLPTSVQYEPTKKFNYCQIFRTSMSITGTALNTTTRTEPMRKQAKIDALEQHSLDMEHAFLFGERKEVAAGPGGHPIRSTRGVVRWIEADAAANDFTATGGTMDEDEFLSYVEKPLRYGSNEKLVIGGSTGMTVMTKIAKNGTSFFADHGQEMVYGVRLRRFVTAHGDLLFRQSSLFNMYEDLQKTLLILDMGMIRYRYMRNRDLQFIRHRQLPGEDAEKSEFFGECGLELHHAQAFGIIRGIASHGA